MALERPEIDPPEGDVPRSSCAIGDIVVGDGVRGDKPGSKVSLQCPRASRSSTGEEFDASWNRGQPFKFRIGEGQVITGLGPGVPGMRVGGRRS